MDFLDEIGVEKPHLVGHSLGGMLAAEIAALAPRQVGRLVLVCPAGLWLDPVPIPDFFTFSPEQLVRTALHDPNGPVGKMLNKMGRHPNRPGHIHMIVSAPGYQPVATHLFVAGSPYLDSDAVFAVKDSLIVDFEQHAPGIAPTGDLMEVPFYTAAYDFRLAPAAGPSART